MGKTVTTYLIDGDPKGTQYAFISNKICQMFVVPRSNFAYLNSRKTFYPFVLLYFCLQIKYSFNCVFKLKKLADRIPHGANCARATRD